MNVKKYIKKNYYPQQLLDNFYCRPSGETIYTDGLSDKLLLFAQAHPRRTCNFKRQAEIIYRFFFPTFNPRELCPDSSLAVKTLYLLYFLSYFPFPQIPCNHTYLVLRRRGASRADHVYRFNKAASLGLLGPLSPIRQFAISVVTNRYPYISSIKVLKVLYILLQIIQL